MKIQTEQKKKIPSNGKLAMSNGKSNFVTKKDKWTYSKSIEDPKHINLRSEYDLFIGGGRPASSAARARMYWRLARGLAGRLDGPVAEPAAALPLPAPTVSSLSRATPPASARRTWSPISLGVGAAGACVCAMTVAGTNMAVMASTSARRFRCAIRCAAGKGEQYGMAWVSATSGVDLSRAVAAQPVTGRAV